MAKIILKDVVKIYPGNKEEVVKSINLEIRDKEFLVLVGPSGCGKSTTLRMIAGLEDITSGELYFDEELMNDIPGRERNIAMVFQNYALYPHMSVYQNIAYSLKLKKMPKDEIKERVEHVAKLLGLTDYLERKPKQLSGGQRQRVALGRAIVRDARVFLMDEPLSNLDAKLRVQMRAEINKLHQEIQKTIVYVTHDQVEAMTMADRIVIMDNGIIQQIGTPKEVFDAPNNLFVAGFIGTPAINFLKGKVLKDGTFVTPDGVELVLNEKQVKLVAKHKAFGKQLVLGIRPDSIDISTTGALNVKIDIAELLGMEYNLLFNLGSTPFVARIKAENIIASGDNLNIAIDMDKVHLFNEETTIRLT